MKAFTNTTVTKSQLVNQLLAHRNADQIIQGYGYWSDGKGCAVGCTIHGEDHMEYEPRFGIPVTLAYLEDRIFEGLPVELAREWPLRFIQSVNEGADLSLVGWKFLAWLVDDVLTKFGTSDVRKGCASSLEIIHTLASGGTVTESAAWSAASAAESAAESAARSAARSASESAASAAWSAASAAWSAASAARSAAWSAARSAAWSASSAAMSAAESAAESASYVLMADNLIEIISSTK